MNKQTSSGNRTTFPNSVNPMLCTLVQEPFSKPGWLFELKWDGYRIIAFKQKNKVTLRSRSGLDYTARYPAVVKSLKTIKSDFVMDGEIVAMVDGIINFDAVQTANPDTPLTYYAFDLLWLNGYSITQLPLLDRKEILKSMIPAGNIIKISDHFEDGIALYADAQQLELEGIVAKKDDSPYQQGKRGNDWLKIPVSKRQEFVIGGYAESEKARAFRSLLFGTYNNKGDFEWVGRSGGGFKEAEMPGILKKLKAIEIKESPFVNKVLDTKGATIHYVKPKLVANFKFATWTKSGRIRKPATFLGFRSDKDPKTVVREIPLSKQEEKKVVEKKSNTKQPKKPKTSENSNWPELEKSGDSEIEYFEIDDCKVPLANVERELWPGITKAKLIMYYNRIQDYILPQIRNRPLSLHIKPYAITAPGLYIKDMEGRQPECGQIFSTKRKHPKPGKRAVIDYLVCNNAATLLWLINLGCIDINPWTATTDDYLHPDYIVIDLDPSDEDFKKAIVTAQAAKQFFDEHKLKAFIKTSGKTGMHLLLPCKNFSFPEARSIAENICEQVHSLVPGITTTNVSINQRGNNLYLDPNQNDEADTIASAYSCRPFHVPTVSTPLEWKEVNDKLDPYDLTIQTLEKRLQKKKDLWSNIYSADVSSKNSNILKQFL